jgi:hypothetical protein
MADSRPGVPSLEVLHHQLEELREKVNDKDTGLAAIALDARDALQTCTECQSLRRRLWALIVTLVLAVTTQIGVFLYQWGAVNESMRDLTQEVEKIRNKLDDLPDIMQRLQNQTRRDLEYGAMPTPRP